MWSSLSLPFPISSPWSDCTKLAAKPWQHGSVYSQTQATPQARHAFLAPVPMMNMKVEPGVKPPYFGALDCALKTVLTRWLREKERVMAKRLDPRDWQRSMWAVDKMGRDGEESRECGDYELCFFYQKKFVKCVCVSFGEFEEEPMCSEILLNLTSATAQRESAKRWWSWES